MALPPIPAPPVMPPELARQCLVDAIESTMGVLHLLADSMRAPTAPTSLAKNAAARAMVAKLCEETAYTLNGAAADAGM